MKKTLLLCGLALILVLTGCKAQAPTVNDNTENSQNQNNEITNSEIPNPASTNCLAKGGRSELRKNENGDYGVCLFEDNRQCEEWSLFRGDCPEGGVKVTGLENEAQIYCVITGGQVQGVGTETPMCKRLDGTLCTTQANFDGDCPDPNDPNPNAGNVETP